MHIKRGEATIALEAYLANILCPSNLEYFAGFPGTERLPNTPNYYVGQLMTNGTQQEENGFYIAYTGRDHRIKVKIHDGYVYITIRSSHLPDAVNKSPAKLITRHKALSLADPDCLDKVLSIIRRHFEGIEDAFWESVAQSIDDMVL